MCIWRVRGCGGREGGREKEREGGVRKRGREGEELRETNIRMRRQPVYYSTRGDILLHMPVSLAAASSLMVVCSPSPSAELPLLAPEASSGQRFKFKGDLFFLNLLPGGESEAVLYYSVCGCNYSCPLALTLPVLKSQ